VGEKQGIMRRSLKIDKKGEGKSVPLKKGNLEGYQTRWGRLPGEGQTIKIPGTETNQKNSNGDTSFTGALGTLSSSRRTTKANTITKRG